MNSNGAIRTTMIRIVNAHQASKSTLSGPSDIGASVKFRIGKVPWHTGHDYELTKFPVEFLIVSDTHRRWALSQRPVPENVTFVTSEELAQADLLILHVDQWIFQEIDKLRVFRRYLEVNVPKIIINHGSNMVDGCSSEDMRALVNGHKVVCNSVTALSLWQIPNSIYVRHGMSPEEWPQTNYGRQNIVITQPFSKIHTAYRNSEAIVSFEARTGIKLDWVGRDHRFDTFDKYRAFLSKSSIYFNPSFASPNPRARTEAMLCGLVPVTTDSHGESEYIENGVNGYCSNNIDELFECLIDLSNNPRKCMKMGMAARRTAQRVFHISNFISQWRSAIAQVLGRSFDV
jgi:hypothetical protein